MKAGAHPALALDKVRYVGDHVAVVIAETLNQANDAAELVSVDYDVHEAVVDLAGAQHPHRPQVHEQAPNNTVFQWHLGDKAAVDAAFGKAKHVTKIELANNRLIPNAIEPRAAIGEYDRGSGGYTLYTTSQNPHVARLVLSAFIGIAAENKLRVIAPDVGGAFGSKIFIYAEEVVCVWASRKVGRPVKWVAERTESFLADAHGRDHLTIAEAAMDETGKILALRVQTTANLGAYLSTFASSMPTYLYAPLLSGQYDIPAIYCEVDAVYTNTAPVDAYRGAGRPEATFVVERLMEIAARQLGKDPADFRMHNFISSFPHATPVIMTYDAGDYHRCMKKALELADYAGFARRKAQSRTAGKLRGIGFSAYIEACGLAPSRAVGSLGAGVGLWESAEVRVNPVGTVEVLTGKSQSRPGSRDDLRAARVAPSGNSDGANLDRARRYRQGADGHGLVRVALRCGRHVGDLESARQGRCQGDEGRCALHGGGRRRRRFPRWRVFRARHEQVDELERSGAPGLCRAQIRHVGNRAGAEGRRLLRSDQFHLPRRRAHRRGRDRSGNRSDENSSAGRRSTISGTSSIP